MVRRLTVVGAVLALVTLGACGGDDGGSGDGDGGTMRFVFSPDPVWNWLEDEGILAEMEEESGFHIERNESEDEFAFFAGGHADLVSTGSYETPVLEAESDVETVTIGKYNKAKDIIIVAGRLGIRDVRRPRAGMQARGGVVQWLHDRVAGARPGPARADDRRRARGHPDGDHGLQHRGGPREERRPVCGRHVDLQRECGLDGRKRRRPVRRQVGLAALRRGVRPGPRGHEQQQLRRAQELVRRAPGGGRVLPRGLGPRTAGVGDEQGRDPRRLPRGLRLHRRRRSSTS